MGYVVIGLAFGIVMFASAIATGWGFGFALLIGWLGASLGIVAIVGLAALRLPARTTTVVEDEAIGA